MKTAREQLDILTAYQELGSYRAAAMLCGTTHKTVRRVVERRTRPAVERSRRPRSTDAVRDLIAARIAATDGRISAKRLLPVCRAAGYGGSARHLRRAVAEARREHRRDRRVYRPWHPVPGEHLVIDWGVIDGLHVFCAVLAWSRVRFVRFAEREDQATTLRLLAECFETLGGVPAVVLTDRMGCLKGGVVANVVVPASGLVRFAAHYRFRPDFCEAADPESKGVVEALVGYAKRDLVVGLGPFSDVAQANTAALAWCAEVNGRVHGETSAVPDERLATERSLLRPLPSLRPAIGKVELRRVDHLRTVRHGSARYSVPGAFIGQRVGLTVDGNELVIRHGGSEIARHQLRGPGEMSILDAHYGRAARTPIRAVRPRTAAERSFLALGPTAEAFLRAAAASGATKLPAELELLAGLERAHGREALVAALARALAFRRFRAADVRAILAAGSGVQRPVASGSELAGSLPSVPVRPLSAYALEPLAADLEAALRRLKLATVRRQAAEVMQAAKTQRWPPEELLRTLLEAELAARDASNAAARRRQAGFPVAKNLDEFDVAASSVPRATFDYLASLEWIRARENLVLVGPAGTGKSHLLVALGLLAIEAGSRVRYFAAVELVETLYRGLADNSVGRVIEGVLRADLVIVDELGFAPLDDVGTQLLFRFVAAAYERRSLGVASHWPFESWGRFLPEHTTAVSLLDRLLHHASVVVTEGESFRMREARSRGGGRSPSA